VQVGFQGFISVANGGSVFESRATKVSSWSTCFIRDALLVDAPAAADLALGLSYAVATSSFEKDSAYEKMGGPQAEGVLLPWNEWAGGGMLLDNITWVGFANPCLR
jgi:hypothetical protein